MPLFLILPSFLLAMPIADEPGGCFDRVPQALPAPNSEFDGQHQTIAIHLQQSFLFRIGSSEHLRLIETPVERNQEPLTYDLSRTEEMVVAEGVRFERYESPTLDDSYFGRCFALHESPDGVRAHFRSGIYGRNILCITKRGDAERAEPNTPELDVTAEPPTYGTPSSSGGNDLALIARCPDPMITGTGNITVVVSGLTATPSVLLLELLDEGSVLQTRELLIHERMVETQRPLTVRFRSNSASGQQIRATHRILGGETGEAVLVDVAMPSSCQHLPGGSLLLLLGLVLLRRRRQLV